MVTLFVSFFGKSMTFTNRYSLVIIVLFIGSALLSGFPIKDIGANILFGLTVFLLLFSASVAGYVDARVTQYITALSMWLGFTIQSLEFFIFSIIGAAVFLLLRRISNCEAFANLHWLVPTMAFVWILPTSKVYPYILSLLQFLPTFA